MVSGRSCRIDAARTTSPTDEPTAAEAVQGAPPDAAVPAGGSRAALAEAMVDVLPAGMALVDPWRRVRASNPAFTRLAGVESGDRGGWRLEALAASARGRERLLAAWRELGAGGQWSIELACRHQAGQRFFGHVTLTPVAPPHPAAGHVAVLLSDITERRRREAELRRRAFHDALTGLPNRALLLDRLAAALREARRHGNLAGILLVDLDRLKDVNDGLGHAAGDACLKETARRLRGAVRDHDTIARLGGDEFVVVLPDLHRIRDAHTVAEALGRALRAPLQLAASTLDCSSSIGIAVYPRDGSHPAALLHSADGAMYRAKSAGGGTCRSCRDAAPDRAFGQRPDDGRCP